tara:strand:- start:489 stop:923 length:435 start_codon:yes stop_codon:yes gene_type:complete
MKCINCNKKLQQGEGYIHNINKELFEWICSRECDDSCYTNHNKDRDKDVLSILEPFRICLYYMGYCHFYKQITHAYHDYTDRDEILIYTDTKDVRHMEKLNKIEQDGNIYFSDIKFRVEYKHFKEELPVLNEREIRYQIYPSLF